MNFLFFKFDFGSWPIFYGNAYCILVVHVVFLSLAASASAQRKFLCGWNVLAANGVGWVGGFLHLGQWCSMGVMGFMLFHGFPGVSCF